MEGMYLCVVTEPTPPFAIVAASRGWLQFCGFDAKEVKGRTLSMLQGPATERVVAAKLVSAAHKGVATDAVLVNYTKHCLAFRNHVRVHPFTKDGVLEKFKVTAPPSSTPSARVLVRGTPRTYGARARTCTPPHPPLAHVPVRPVPLVRLSTLTHAAASTHPHQPPPTPR